MSPIVQRNKNKYKVVFKRAKECRQMERAVVHLRRLARNFAMDPEAKQSYIRYPNSWVGRRRLSGVINWVVQWGALK